MNFVYKIEYVDRYNNRQLHWVEFKTHDDAVVALKTLIKTFTNAVIVSYPINES